MPRKPKEPKLPAPLNMSENLNDMLMLDCGVMQATEDNDDFGVFTVVTAKGHYDFIIDQDIANRIVQLLRKYIAGESKPLIDEN